MGKLLHRIRGKSEFDSRIWMIFTGNLIIASGFSLFFPFLSIYFEKELGVNYSVIGLVWLGIGVSAAVSEILGGAMADRFGRRRVIILGLVFRAAMFALVAVAVTLSWGFLAISGLIVISFLLGDIMNPALNAMIADVVEPAKRMDAYGLVRVGGNLGYAIGVVMGGILATISYPLVFAVTSLSAAVYGVIAWKRIPESIPSVSKERQRVSELIRPFRDGHFAIFSLGLILLVVLMSQFNATLPAFLNSRVGITEQQIGMLYAINGVMIVLFQMPITRALGRKDLAMVMVLGSMLYSFAYLSVSAVGSIGLMALVMVVITTAEMIAFPTSMNLVARLSPESHRGRYMGAYGLILSSGSAFGPFIGGMIIDHFESSLVIWGSLSTLGVMAAGGFLYLKSMMRRPAPKPAGTIG